MIAIFTEKNLLEDIIIESKKFPNWYLILKFHSKIYINLTPLELENEIKSDSTLIGGFYHQMSGYIKIEANKDFFDQVYRKPKNLIQNPRAAYFLNISTTDAYTIQNEYGVIVFTKDAIQDNILKGRIHWTLEKNKKHIGLNNETGWKGLFGKFPIPPSNSLIISDNYLLKDVDLGILNFSEVLKIILPSKLKTEFHLLIRVTNEYAIKNNHEKIFESLNNAVNEFKSIVDFNIKFELIFLKHQEQHDRYMFLNYSKGYSGYGYALFKPENLEKCSNTTTFDFSNYYELMAPELYGQTIEEGSRSLLTISKKLWKDLRNTGGDYFCNFPNPTWEVKNRLLSDL